MKSYNVIGGNFDITTSRVGLRQCLGARSKHEFTYRDFKATTNSYVEFSNVQGASGLCMRVNRLQAITLSN